MNVEILTIFPELFSSFLGESLIEKAISRELLSVTITNVRDFADPPHFHVDDTPYGGGAGMVMRPEPLTRAIAAAKKRLPDAVTILFTPAGAPLKQQQVKDLSSKNLILVCGRYEGVDQRVIESHIDHEISIGDYVLMGGELPAMVLIEAVTRLVPGIVGNPESIEHESFSLESLLEGPQYTRPATFEGKGVPEILLSGDHSKIAKWRLAEAKKKTKNVRPDLIDES